MPSIPPANDTERVTPQITSARFLTGDLIKVCMEQIRQQQIPWGALPEKEQQKTIDRVTDVCSKAARESVKIIAGLGRPACQAEIEQVVFKDGIKVTLTMSKLQADRHAIADATGAGVLLVLPDYDAIAGGAPPKADPDQPRLDLADPSRNRRIRPEPHDFQSSPRPAQGRKAMANRARVSVERGAGCGTGPYEARTMMLSAWWILVAFIAGGLCGMLVTALLKMTAQVPRRDARLHDPLGVMPFDRPSQA